MDPGPYHDHDMDRDSSLIFEKVPALSWHPNVYTSNLNFRSANRDPDHDMFTDPFMILIPIGLILEL